MSKGKTATLTLGDQSYAVADLSPLAQELQGDMAVSQTAQVAYARALRDVLGGNAPDEAK